MSEREIKFRAWDKEHEEWLKKPFSIYFNDAPAVRVLCRSSEEFDRILVVGENCILNQYTGLKDRNGFEIYDGDIIFEEAQEYNGVVIFFDGSFQVVFENIVENLSECTDWAVIGNVWENKDLLGASDEYNHKM